MKEHEKKHSETRTHMISKFSPFVVAVALLYLTILEKNRWHSYWPNHLVVDAWPQQLISVPRGQRKQFLLPDSTVVWLNALSTLQYPVNMRAGERVVNLTGEAFFKVVKNTAHPFLVRTQNFQAEVLGTSFNIRAYPNELMNKTVVTEGAVKITIGDEEAILRAQEAASISPFSQDSAILKISQYPNVTAATDWINGLLYWDKVDFRTVLNDLSLAHNVDITWKGNLNCKFTGQYKITIPVEDVIERVLSSCGRSARIDKLSEHRLIVSLLP